MADEITAEDKLRNTKKMIFTGLDNSGKTSINMTLKQNKGSLGLVKPTYLVDRSVFEYLNYEIIQHDLGGQKKYLISYLKEPGLYFNDTDIAVLVIDVQDKERFDEAIDYFKEVFDRFEKLGIQPEVWALYHKAERFLFEADEEDSANIENLKERMLELNSGRFLMEHAITSIYDDFSITETFGKMFRRLYPKSMLVDELLETLSQDLNAEIIALIDDNVLPVAYHVNSSVEIDFIKFTVPYLYRLKERLANVEEGESGNLIQVESGGRGFIFMELPTPRVKLYLLVIGIKEAITKAKIYLKVLDFSPRIADALGID